MSQNDYTVEARDTKFDQSDKEGSIQTVCDESPSGQTDVYGVIARPVAEALGEYFTVTVTDDEEATQASLTGDTKNFGKFETASRQAYGIGIRRSILADVFGEELPESVGLQFAPSSQENYEAALESMDDDAEDEVDALIAGIESEEEEETEADAEADSLVEISDEELGIEQ